MKRVLLLFSSESVGQGQADPRRLAELLEQQVAPEPARKMKVDYTEYESLVHIVSATKAAIIDAATGTDIAEYDVVYHRRWKDVIDQAAACACYLSRQGVRNIDREAYAMPSITKLTQMWRLWEAGLPIPATVYASGERAMEWLLKHLDMVPFSFPMVVKGVEATRGEHNFLVETSDELQSIFARHPNMAFLIQEFIVNDGDYRVLVCGESAKLIMHRRAVDGRHLNNTSQGGQATLVSLADMPSEVIADCVRAAGVFNREVAGVDVVVNKSNGRHYFFEVNRSPQIESGQFATEKAAVLADYLSDLTN